MSYDVMLAHKMAAWNERRLIRDLYDIYFFHSFLGVFPDLPTLQNRLSSISYRDRRFKDAPKQMTLKEFFARLEEAVERLGQKEIDEELRDSLPPEERPGLHIKMKIGIKKMIHSC